MCHWKEKYGFMMVRNGFRPHRAVRNQSDPQALAFLSPAPHADPQAAAVLSPDPQDAPQAEFDFWFHVANMLSLSMLSSSRL